MKRYLCWLAVLGLAVVPDWASAFQPCWYPRRPCLPYYPPAPPVYVVPCIPVYEVPLPPPRIYTTPQQPAKPSSGPAAAAPKPATPPIPPAAATTPNVEPTFRPVGGTPPPPTSELIRSAGGATKTPLLVPELPAKPDATSPKLPPIELPALPGGTDAKPPMMPATPSPAPAPLDPGPMAPEQPKRPGNDPLPPLVLPPDSPAGPSGVVPPMGGPSTSRSSPLTGGVKGGPTVQVYPATGTATGATRQIGFFNHTNQDIELVIEGRAVKLPRKAYIHAEVPPTFRWKHGENAVENATVPDGAAGLDVLFRE